MCTIKLAIEADGICNMPSRCPVPFGEGISFPFTALAVILSTAKRIALNACVCVCVSVFNQNKRNTK